MLSVYKLSVQNVLKTPLTQGLSQNVRLYKVTGSSALKMKGMEVGKGGGGVEGRVGREEGRRGE